MKKEKVNSPVRVGHAVSRFDAVGEAREDASELKKLNLSLKQRLLRIRKMLWESDENLQHTLYHLRKEESGLGSARDTEECINDLLDDITTVADQLEMHSRSVSSYVDTDNPPAIKGE